MEPMLILPNLDKVFEVDCDSLHVKSMLSQEGRYVTFFSKILNEKWKKYSIYDVEFYAII